MSICCISPSLIARTFGGASAAGLLAFSASALFDHQTAPERPAKTTAAISRRVKFTFLSPAPPDSHSAHHDQQRDEHDALVEHHRHLPRGHVETAVFRLLGTNRNQVLVRRKPVHHVEEQVPVPVEAQKPVRYP